VSDRLLRGLALARWTRLHGATCTGLFLRHWISLEGLDRLGGLQRLVLESRGIDASRRLGLLLHEGIKLLTLLRHYKFLRLFLVEPLLLLHEHFVLIVDEIVQVLIPSVVEARLSLHHHSSVVKVLGKHFHLVASFIIHLLVV